MRALEGVALLGMRIAWLAVALALVSLASVGFVRAFEAPERIMLPALTDLFVAFGLGFRPMIVVALLLPFIVVVVIAGVVYRRRSDDPMALLFTVTLLGLYTFVSRGLLTFDRDSFLGHAVSVVFVVTMVCLLLVLALFPSGRFAPRAARLLVPAGALAVVAFPDAGRVLMSFVDGEIPATGRVQAIVLVLSALLLTGLAAQVHRYRRVSGPVERQQIKWVMAPLAVFLALMVAALGVAAVFPASGDRWVGWVLFVMVPIGTLMPVMVANAVLRYRLYEIDRIISRTVSYGLIVAVLAAVYAALVVLLGAAVPGLAGREGSPLSVAVSVLAVAALFRPVQRRVHAMVDRRFNRTGYEARVAVQGFARSLRDEVDLDAIRGNLLSVALSTVEPARASVWLAGQDGRSGRTPRTARAATHQPSGIPSP